MNSILLSIIVPMYKVEQYIAQCLNSIITQNHSKQIEIIVIDDGSPDKSGEIARSIAQCDERIHVFSQVNKGLSAARNYGLQHAKGEYVWFIDSDDWIADNSIATIIETIKEYAPEAVHISSADIVDGIPQKLFSLAGVAGIPKTGMEMIRSANFHGVVQYTIYQRAFLAKNKLQFREGIYHEDTEFSPRAYFHLKKVVSIDQIFYLKRVNEDSITRKINPKKNFDLIQITDSLLQFASKIDDKNDRKIIMRLTANALRMAINNESEFMTSDTRLKLNKALYEHRYLLRSFFQSDKFSYKVAGALLWLFSRNMLFPNRYILQNRFLRTYVRKL